MQDTQYKKGLVIVHTGNGKGKTTAALGLAIRAWGEGLKVLILQFIKGSWKYGELKALAKFAPDITVKQCGSTTSTLFWIFPPSPETCSP